MKASKLPMIHKAIQDILDELPNFEKNIYLLQDYEYGMDSIAIMYDSYHDGSKIIKIDKGGAYIAGRGQS